MLNIFEYTDFRKYLADWFGEKKKAHPAFSYASFAQKAGFSDRGFFHNVIHGKRGLTKESLVKVSQAIGHSKAEAEYFENLVFFNKAGDLEGRNYFFEKLNGVRGFEKKAVGAQQLRRDQYEFYSNWYHVVIRSLIDLYPAITDYAQLAKMVYPAVKPKEAKKSVELLLRLGLVERQKNGSFRISSKVLSTGREVQSLAVQHFHLACMELAARALRELQGDKRNISGLTLGISRKAYDKICDIIYSTQEKILEVAEKDTDSDSVYQLNFHFFPVSRTTPNSGELKNHPYPSLTKEGSLKS
jgi:uncharacterized protein (TIGR02147 family)